MVNKLFRAGIILLLTFSLRPITQAQGSWELVYSNTDQYIEEIVFIPGTGNNWQTGWAIEQSGNVLKTTDGGDTWTTYSTLPNGSISGICFIDENVGWICTYNGKILKTMNGGASWTLNYSGGTWFSAIKFSDDQHGVVTGIPCKYTSDGGASWQTATGGMQYNAMCYAGGSTFWACEMWSGKVARSTDNGQTWSNIHTIPQMLAAIDFADEDNGLSGGSGMTCEITHDGGATWTSKTLGNGSGDFLSASWFDNDTVWAGTSNGIYKSTNGGSSWTPDTIITGIAHRAMFITPTNVIYVAGDVMSAFDSQIWRKNMTVPTAGFTASDTLICSGDSVTFTNQSSPDATSFLWTFEGGTPPTSTEINPTVVFLNSGEFDITLEASGPNGTGTLTKPGYIHANAAPQPAISGPTLVCPTEVSDYLVTGVPGNIYAWSVTGGTILSGADTSFVTVAWGLPGAGTVTLTESTAEGCISTTDAYAVAIDECTGTGSNRSPVNLVISPNPATEMIRIKAPQAGKLRVYSIHGKQVMNVLVAPGEQWINLTKLSPGIYTFHFLTEDNITSGKLVKE